MAVMVKRSPAKRRRLKIGMAYPTLVGLLNPDDLYAPASIARFALDNGLVKNHAGNYQRIRINMSRWADRYAFPDEGDGTVFLKGRAPTPGWFGRRWAEPLDEAPVAARLTAAGISVRSPCRTWPVERLLAQKGEFLLAEVAAHLQIEAARVIRYAGALSDEGCNPYLLLGMRCLGGCWLVKLSLFAPIFRNLFWVGDEKARPFRTVL
jgi:hypothetical protein